METPQIPTVKPPDTTELESEALVLRDRAAVAKVTSQAEYEAAGAELVRVSRNIRAIEAIFEQPIHDLFNAHRGFCAIKNKLLEYPRAAERAWKGAMAVYHDEQERLRRLEEARIASELRKQEEDRILAEAETLASQGHQEEAEAILEQPVTVPAVRIQAPVTRGISSRKGWTFRIVDQAKINRAFLTPDLVKIGRQVTALGPAAAGLVGGIEVLRETTMVVRSR